MPGHSLAFIPCPHLSLGEGQIGVQTQVAAGKFIKDILQVVTDCYMGWQGVPGGQKSTWVGSKAQAVHMKKEVE